MRRSWLIELATNNAATQNDILGWTKQTRANSAQAAAVQRDMYRARGFWVRVTQEFGGHGVMTYAPIRPGAERELGEPRGIDVVSGVSGQPVEDETYAFGGGAAADNHAEEAAERAEEDAAAARADRVADEARDRCADCGQVGEMTGHMGCQYPEDRP